MVYVILCAQPPASMTSFTRKLWYDWRKIHREEYMGARRYGISIRVFNSIAHEWESSDKLTCAVNHESFAVHSSTWPSGAKGEWRVSSWLAISNTREKIRYFFTCCYGFSQGWKSLYNTVVYMMNPLCGNQTGARYIPKCGDLIGASNILLYSLT